MALTPAQLDRQLARLASRTPQRVSANAMRRVTRNVAKRGRDRIRTKGVGRRIWGKKPKGLLKMVTVGRVTESGGLFRTSVGVQGLPALMETGGRTKGGYTIKARRGGVLAFEVGGKTLFGREVTHPGSHVNRDPSVAPELEQAVPEFGREMQRDLDRWIEATTRF